MTVIAHGVPRASGAHHASHPCDREFAEALADPRALRAEALAERVAGALAATVAAVERGQADPLRYARTMLQVLGVPEPGDEQDLDKLAAGVPLYGRPEQR
jgi:hypothetical protein